MNDRTPLASTAADVGQSLTAPIAGPALWNPNAAASWSLVFTPVFGAILQMKNWQALGETDRAAKARSWAFGCAIYLALLTIASLALPGSRGLDALIKASSIVLLIVWYYANGKAQQSLVLARFGRGYPRRGWAKPLLVAVLANVAYLAVSVAIGLFIEYGASGLRLPR